LATELPRLHKNLFFQITEEEFQHAVAQLYEAIPSMRDDEIIIGIARVVAMVGDGHTRLNLLQEAAGFRVYPLSLYWFKDGLYVVKTTSEYSRVLRSRVVQIGDTDIEEASVAVSALISHENEAQLRNRSPDYLVTPEILHALSILPDMQSGRFVFEDAQGNRFALNMAPVARNEKSEWLSAVDPAMDPTPLYRQKPNVYYWFEYMENWKTIYVQYNVSRSMEECPFDEFTKDLFAFVDTHPVERFVFDIRNNEGGSSQVAQPLIAALKRRHEITQNGRLFMVVGRRTFSSAILNAIQLRNETDVIVVGEPTGGKPSHYGEVRSFFLPNSGLKVTYSTKYFTPSKEETPSLMPDIVVELSSAEYFAGRDPVLETILGYQGK
jgi:hypothetical protein